MNITTDLQGIKELSAEGSVRLQRTGKDCLILIIEDDQPHVFEITSESPITVRDTNG